MSCAQVLSEKAELFFMTLVVRLVNDDALACRTLVARALGQLCERVGPKKVRAYALSKSAHPVQSHTLRLHGTNAPTQPCTLTAHAPQRAPGRAALRTRASFFVRSVDDFAALCLLWYADERPQMRLVAAQVRHGASPRSGMAVCMSPGQSPQAFARPGGLSFRFEGGGGGGGGDDIVDFSGADSAALAGVGASGAVCRH